jgi:HEAT repeat protein
MRSLFAASVVVLIVGSLALGGASGTPKKEDVPKYLKMLKTSTVAKDRALAAEMLGKRGAIKVSDVEDAMEPLKLALKKDTENSVKAAAATALGNIGSDPENTVPLLIDALKEKSVDVKIAAMRALGQYAAMARDAVPALREIAKENKEKDKKLTMEAVLALKNIAGKKK